MQEGERRQARGSGCKKASVDDGDAWAEARPLVFGVLVGATAGQSARKVGHAAEVLLRAATRAQAVNAACARSEDEGDAARREVARVLESLQLEAAQEEINRLMWADVKGHLPTGDVEVAVDLNMIPYHGEPFESPDELTRGEARGGTTWFHVYATLYVIAPNRRYTVALRLVKGTETPTQALKYLIAETLQRGLRPRMVYADKAFATTEGLQWLQEHVPAGVIPLPLKGKRAKALCRGRASHWDTYTMHHHKTKQPLDLKVAVVIKRNGDKYHNRKKGRNAYFPYVAWGLDHATPQRVDRLYRNRGGIESSYRQNNKARARTTSRNPAIRLVYYAVALILQNAWIHLRWRLSQPKRGRTGRTQPPGFFPFTEYLELLAAHLRKLLGERLIIYQLEKHA